VRILGLSLREHIGGSVARGWIIFALYLPGAILAPLANINTAVGGTTLAPMLVASLVSVLPIALAFLLAGLVPQRLIRRPIPLWLIAGLGAALGGGRSALMYVASVEMGLQAPDLELAWTRIVGAAVVGIVLLPLGLLFVSCIWQYRTQRKALLADYTAAFARTQADEQRWDELRDTLITPLLRDLDALQSQLATDELSVGDVGREVRRRAHDLWDSSRPPPPPRLGLRGILAISHSTRLFPTALICALWVATTISAVLSLAGPIRSVAALLIGTALGGAVFEAANWLVRHHRNLTWIIVPGALVIAGIAMSPVVEYLARSTMDGAWTHFWLSLAWLATLAVACTVVANAAMRGDEVLQDLHQRYDVTLAQEAVRDQERRATVDDLARTLHGGLQSRLAAAQDSGEARRAISEAMILLTEPVVPVSMSLQESVARAIQPWATLLTIECRVSGESNAATNALTHEVVAEAVCNAFRHGNARTAKVDVSGNLEGVRISIDDDGTNRLGAAGLGSALFDKAGRWHRSASPSGTHLVVHISPSRATSE